MLEKPEGAIFDKNRSRCSLCFYNWNLFNLSFHKTNISISHFWECAFYF